MPIYGRMFQCVESNQIAIKQYLIAEREPVEISALASRMMFDAPGLRSSIVGHPEASCVQQGVGVKGKECAGHGALQSTHYQFSIHRGFS